MAADLNRVTLVGRLTKDPELRHTGSGTAVLGIRLAVSTRTKQGESWEDKSNYFDVTVWGRQAEVCAEHLAKGRRIGVDGRLDWREWKAQDGTNRQAVQVVANDVFFLDSPKDRDTGQGELPVDAPAAKPADDDVPF